jgi:hypothetical protein
VFPWFGMPTSHASGIGGIYTIISITRSSAPGWACEAIRGQVFIRSATWNSGMAATDHARAHPLIDWRM